MKKIIAFMLCGIQVTCFAMNKEDDIERLQANSEAFRTCLKYKSYHDAPSCYRLKLNFHDSILKYTVHKSDTAREFNYKDFTVVSHALGTCFEIKKKDEVLGYDTPCGLLWEQYKRDMRKIDNES